MLHFGNGPSLLIEAGSLGKLAQSVTVCITELTGSTGVGSESAQRTLRKYSVQPVELLRGAPALANSAAIIIGDDHNKQIKSR